MSRPPRLDVAGVSKSYGATVALDEVDLVLDAGTVLGLLGPNGAGKTSPVSIVAGLRRPDTGTVHVDGVDVVTDPERACALIGYAPQETGVYPPLTVWDNLRFFGGLAGLRRRELRERIDELGAALALEGLFDRLGAQLSGGERRRLHTAIALVGRPKLVLLDEPTTGADVLTRGRILQLVQNLADQGSAVVYSTHYLQEIEELGARVSFIDRGRVVAQGETSELVRQHGSSALELTFDGPVPAVARVAGAAVDGSSVRIPTNDAARTAAELLSQLDGDATRLRGIEVIRPTLETVYLSVTGRRYDEHGAVPA